jgi:hypothetical protein
LPGAVLGAGLGRCAVSVRRLPRVACALVPPVLAQFLVMQPAELMGVVVKPVCGAFHLVEVMAVIPGDRLLLAPFAHDVQFFVAELNDLRQGLS